jgi:hypothetical protein
MKLAKVAFLVSLSILSLFLAILTFYLVPFETLGKIQISFLELSIFSVVILGLFTELDKDKIFFSSIVFLALNLFYYVIVINTEYNPTIEKWPPKYVIYQKERMFLIGEKEYIISTDLKDYTIENPYFCRGTNRNAYKAIHKNYWYICSK